MFEIIPGIFEKDWKEIERKIELVKSFTKTIHIDLIDGKFADNTSFMDPAPFKKYTKDMFFELHMMVENPLQYIQPFAEAGFKRFIGHIEKMSDVSSFVGSAELFGEVGLAVDGKTDLTKLITPLIDLDTVLIMMIDAGFSGQAFQEKQLEKIKALREKDELVTISVDGGITDKTITKAKDAGANRFVTTSFLFESDHPQKQFEKLVALLTAEENF